MLDLRGERFGRLVALEMIKENNKQRTKWLCKCDCGNEKLIPLSSLRSGSAKSCGCLRKEVASKTFKKHGMTDDRLYNIWLNMRTRCNNPKVKSFKHYGERGIKICNEWDIFETFHKWALENGYKEKLTIDRIDNDGDYEPLNCRWVTRKVQMNNTSMNVFVEVGGKTLTLSELAEEYGLGYEMVHHRYETGKRGSELVEPSKKKKLLVTIDGQTKTLKEWSKIKGINYGTLQHRFKKGIRGQELFKAVDPVMSAKAYKSLNKKGSA